MMTSVVIFCESGSGDGLSSERGKEHDCTFMQSNKSSEFSSNK
jgi:hypothetical protein